MEDLTKLLRDLSKGISHIDRSIRKVGEAIEGIESSVKPAPHTHEETERSVEYCLDCCVKHLSAASTFLKEAIQFPDYREKVRDAIKELVGCEDDSLTTRNEEVQKLNSAVRSLRKRLWASPVALGMGDRKEIEMFKSEIDKLLDGVYEIRKREIEATKRYV